MRTCSPVPLINTENPAPTANSTGNFDQLNKSNVLEFRRLFGILLPWESGSESRSPCCLVAIAGVIAWRAAGCGSRFTKDRR